MFGCKLNCGDVVGSLLPLKTKKAPKEIIQDNLYDIFKFLGETELNKLRCINKYCNTMITEGMPLPSIKVRIYRIIPTVKIHAKEILRNQTDIITTEDAVVIGKKFGICIFLDEKDKTKVINVELKLPELTERQRVLTDEEISFDMFETHSDLLILEMLDHKIKKKISFIRSTETSLHYFVKSLYIKPSDQNYFSKEVNQRIAGIYTKMLTDPEFKK